MESDEKYLERKFGRQNHFTVPEGYLQNLTASVMANVGKQPECDAPENETVLTENKTANTRVVVMQPWWRRTRVRIAAAAACLLLAGGTAFYTYSAHHAEPASNMAASAPRENSADSAGDRHACVAMNCSSSRWKRSGSKCLGF